MWQARNAGNGDRSGDAGSYEETQADTRSEQYSQPRQDVRFPFTIHLLFTKKTTASSLTKSSPSPAFDSCCDLFKLLAFKCLDILREVPQLSF